MNLLVKENKMNSKLRTVIGIATSLIPPFLGLWMWYLWWAEQDEWDNIRKLTEWMSSLPLSSERSIGPLIAGWDTPWGELILWEGGLVSLHSDCECGMCGFAGGVMGRRRLNKLITLCKRSLELGG